MDLDQLDIALIGALRQHPRSGELELSRRLGVARATVHARSRRLETAGVITGYGPDVDLAAAGYPVTAFVTLEIAQGALGQATAELTGVTGVLEAYSTTGNGDVLCKVAARSHLELQNALLQLSRLPVVVRSTSIIALSTIVSPRCLELLASGAAPGAPRAPGYRPPGSPTLPIG